MISVTKRDGSTVTFNESKIIGAVRKAFDAKKQILDDEVRYGLISHLKEKYALLDNVSIETIQDDVVRWLQEHRYFDVAIAFATYRERRTIARGSNVDPISLVDDYLEVKDDMAVHENSSTMYSLQGLNNHLFSSISEKYWLSLYSDEIKDAYNRGRIHIHDLGSVSAYCCGWDLKALLEEGFGGVSGKPYSGAPKHFSSALNQANNFIFTLQGEAAGAMAFSNFNTLLAPFVKYDNLSYKEVKQEIQEFVFNLNISTRVGFQAPFSNITLDTDISETNLKEEYVCVGGEYTEDKYSDFQKEADWISLAFVEVMEAGDKLGAMLAYPIITFNVTKNFPWCNKLGQAILKMTASHGSAYFANYINTEYTSSDITSMCPLAGSEKVLTKSTRGWGYEFVNLETLRHNLDRELEIYSNGKFIKAKINKFENLKFVNVKLNNGHNIKMSTTHLNYIMKDKDSNEEIVTAKELKEGLYLPFGLNEFEGKGGIYDLGYFVGAYAGDGTVDDTENGNSGRVTFSLNNTTKKPTLHKLIEICEKYFGYNYNITEHDDSKLVSLYINSKAAVGLCLDFVNGKQTTKRYKSKLFGMSKEFRQGVIDGHVCTDGGWRGRIYTSSIEMVYSLNMLAASMGTVTKIMIDDREASENGKYSDNIIYSVCFYKFSRETYGDVYFIKNDKAWFKIISIEPISNTVGYCFEVQDENELPMFTVGTSGILTHNCRLKIDRNEIANHLSGLDNSEYDKSHQKGHGFFGASPNTGSVGVVTLGLPSIMSDVRNKINSCDIPIIFDAFLTEVKYYMDLSLESLLKKRKVVEHYADKGLYPYIKHYLREVKKRTGQYFAQHFNTICINGFHEAAIIMGLENGIVHPEGVGYAEKLLKFMKDYSIELQKKHRALINIEQAPAESAGVKLCKKSGVDPLNNGYYTNSTWLPADSEIDMFEQIKIQARLNQYYTGGSSYHCYTDADLEPIANDLEKIIMWTFENTTMPYMTISPVFSVCEKCGRIAGKHYVCPKCNSKKIEVYERIVGYYRSHTNWNKGRKKESSKRKYLNFK